MKPHKLLLFGSFLLLFSCNQKKYDLIIKNGLIYDGNGTTPILADIAIKNDTIAFVGKLNYYADAKEIIDAKRHGGCSRFCEYAELEYRKFD